MLLSRRDALVVSGSLAAATLVKTAAAQDKAPAEAWPDKLVEKPLREGFPVPLPLNADGSAPEHPESAAGPIVGRLMWKTADRKPPPAEYDFKKLAIKVDTRGLGKLAGTLHFSDLEKLPAAKHTFLMQCGAAEPHGIVTWGGVRFRDFADMLGLVPGAHYCRLVATDRHYVDEAVETLRHPQVMLAWMMNGKPLPPEHGAPIRLVVPFRYGNRSIKGITEISFATPGLTMPPLPVT